MGFYMAQNVRRIRSVETIRQNEGNSTQTTAAVSETPLRSWRIAARIRLTAFRKWQIFCKRFNVKEKKLIFNAKNCADTENNHLCNKTVRRNKAVFQIRFKPKTNKR